QRLSSPAWRAMLFGPWREARPAHGDWIVSMPEEKPYPTALLLAMIYCRVDLVDPTDMQIGQTEFGFHLASDILVVADKYGLTHVVGPWVPVWINGMKMARSDLRYSLDDLSGPIKAIHVAWEIGSEVQLACFLTDLMAQASPGYLLSVLERVEYWQSKGIPWDLGNFIHGR
ncbi:hypothetical protein C8A03DRAFT_18881, partial [Achaetomium macrosporum]